MNYNPFQILQVSPTDNLNTIREAFKQQALMHHPDRGGNPFMFDLCKRAYNDIYKYKTQQQKQLRKEKRTISSLEAERVSSYGPTLDKGQQKHLERNFNKIFKNVRVETPHDIGYGDMMDRSSKAREDNPKLSRANKFKQNQLIVYEEPQALPTTKDNYEVLGQGKIKDFTNHSKGYTDYMVAHTEHDLKDGEKPHERIARLDNVKGRPKYKSMDQLKTARSNIRYTMSPQDQAKYNEKMRREKEMEEQRKMQFYQHQKQVQKRFNSIHNYLTY